MFLKKELSIYYNIKPSESFMTSIVVLFSGFFILCFSSLFIGNFNKIYLFYVLVTWFWLRLNEIIFSFILKKNIDKNLAFSISWIIPIIIICLFGLFHFDLPIFILAIIAFFDFLFFIIFYKKFLFKIKWKNSFYTFILGIIIISLLTINSGHFVWMSELAYMGIVGGDTLRDAAVFNSWSEYSYMSHGVHGLLFEPYHALFALFLDPFINESVNVFQVFAIFANMIMPAIVVYGCSKIIINFGSKYIIKNWYFFLLFFILSFASLDYILIQRSSLMATLMIIAIIPLVFNIIKNPKNAHLEVILICLLVPITIYARAFHGLFVLGILFYFLLIKKVPYKVIILSSITFSGLFVLLYFGETERVNGGLGHGYFKYFLKSNHIFINSYLIPIILFLLVTFFKKKILSYKISNQSTDDIFLYFIIFVCILTLFLVFRTGGYSDTFYQLLPIYWFMFFFLLTPNFSSVFLGSKRQKKIFQLFNKKSLAIFILLILSINFMEKNLYKIYSNEGYVKRTIKDIRVLNNKWKSNGENEVFISNIDLSVCKKEKFTFACSLRMKIFGSENFRKLSLSLLLNKMINQANYLTNGLDGNTAVYINPSHKYWTFFEFNENNRRSKPSIFFMAVGKLPMIFGAHPDSKTTAFSIKTAQNNGGTLKTLDKIGDKKNLCIAAEIVKIDNIVIFQKEKEPKILQCK